MYVWMCVLMLGLHWSTMEVRGDCIDHPGLRAACSDSSCTMYTLDNQNPGESTKDMLAEQQWTTTAFGTTDAQHPQVLDLVSATTHGSVRAAPSVLAQRRHWTIRISNNASGGARRFRLPRAFENSHRRPRFRRVSNFQDFRPDFFAKSAPIFLRNFGPRFRKVRPNAF